MARPWRWLQDGLNSTQARWVRRYPWHEGGSQLHNYEFDTDIGIDPSPPRYPLQPSDQARRIVRDSGPDRVALMTVDNYKEYKGITMNPQFAGRNEQVVEKNAKVMMPVGSEAVQNGDFLMYDINPQFGDLATDVIPQRAPKTFRHVATTAITALVNNVAGYAAGTTVLAIDTISVANALSAGMTIGIDHALGGTIYYYLIKDITYITGTTANITLAWPTVLGTNNNDTITTAHVADAPIFFPWYTELSENLHSVIKIEQLNAIGGNLTLPPVAFTGAGIAAGTYAIVPNGAGGTFTHPGGQGRGAVGIQVADAMAAGDTIDLLAWFHDKIIRQETIGQAASAGNPRTSLDTAEEVKVELKC